MSEQATLAASAVTKRFGGLVALRDVSVTVLSGEIRGLIGPNGSGKTTLVNILSGLIRPTSGRISLSTRDVTRMSASRFARAGVGRTFQGIRLFSDLTVLENVQAAIAARRGLRAARSWHEEAMSALDHVGIVSLAHLVAGTLPYGSQRRVEVARALALAPDFLLLDEPFAGMNEDESDELLRRLHRIRDDTGCGMLVVDHDLRVIMRLCEWVIVLNEGEVISEGTPESVWRDPAVIEAYMGERAVRVEPGQRGASTAG